MESTGIRNKIQVSQTTADTLIKAGKQSWLTARGDAVAAKGKGVLKTFWVNPSKGRGVGASSVVGSGTNEARELTDLKSADNMDPLTQDTDAKKERLVEWMVELLLIHIKKMVSDRGVIMHSIVCVVLPLLTAFAFPISSLSDCAEKIHWQIGAKKWYHQLLSTCG
jgi:hypothetical protein